MTVEEDVTLGLHATLNSTREEVVVACVRAASALGMHGQSIVASDRVMVKIFPGLVPVLTKVSPLVEINIELGTNNLIVLDAKIQRYKTLQSRFFFIPIGPKRLRGKASYNKFLTSLEQELEAIDKGGGQFRRVGGTS